MVENRIPRGKNAVSELRKKKIKEIADREARKEQIHRMESVLLQKLGNTADLSDASKAVRVAAVREFLTHEENHFDIKEKRRISEYVIFLRSQIENKVARNKKAEKEAAEMAKRDADLRAERSSAPAKEEPKKQNERLKLRLDDPKVDPWALMSMVNNIDAEDGLKKDHDKAISKQKAMAGILSDQVKQKKAIEGEAKEESKKYVDEQRRKYNEWKREQELAEKREADKSRQLRRDRQEHIEQLKHRKKQTAKELRDAELEMMEKIKIDLRKEENKKIEKREEERRSLAFAKKENMEREKLKQKQREEEAALDAKLMREYKAKLDREEEKRIEQFNARLARYEAISLQREEAGFNKKEREKILKVERKILREALAKEKADAERERSDREMLIEKQRRINEDNQMMAKQKLSMEKRKKKAEEAYSVQFRKDIELILEEEREKQMKKKEMDKDHCEQLKEQIKMREKAKEECLDCPHMTDIEKSMNREIMRRIENDSIVQEKILKRMVENEQKKVKPVEAEE
eukprot:CAMPEP_0116025658 /NCGR_PEP_ID=MMETSP0321-20121206/13222_1 /TAXON_ID=163516 /ORGANISM="Leptocylindrus danicus var. danicus, Strain B650" /LENGTH=519 /DNA_ID=CAMNT_0003497979 /DNA_START=178 /DNA_END=1737 /DNA_ORIENTATION=+